MANDRIWLVCKGCGERRLLAKYYPSELWTSQSREGLPDLDDWVGDHMRCSPPARDCEPNLDGETCFKLATDDDVDLVQGRIWADKGEFQHPEAVFVGKLDKILSVFK